VTRAVVFAYSEVGVRCVRELLAQGVEIPLLFTHADDPGEVHWFGSVQALAELHGLRVETPDNPNTAEWIEEGRRLKPDFL
jgi:methionyl-tRNA formyltransferase